MRFCFSVLEEEMASQGGSSRKSLSLSNSSVGGKKKAENGGPDTIRRSFSASRTVYVRLSFVSSFFVFFLLSLNFWKVVMY